jgi:hypothetical protein
MGLDQYLNRVTFLGRENVVTVENGNENEVRIFENVTNITQKVTTWRKAYSIHDFFDNLSEDGLSNNQNLELSRERLEELLELCRQVVANPELAEELLPQYKRQDIEDYFLNLYATIEALKKKLSYPADDDVHYEYSSWW